ncbi:hypothetical protein [Paraburkholderia caledonica]|uniref:hypothetical protein n=1 Tax=Paraburkholderia caledonica TaxID=134536 RepID=UPI0019D042E0|nr:hypothetical protein [Paraburkholderia caledonica]
MTKNYPDDSQSRAAAEEDGRIWRWFSELYGNGRLRWCKSTEGWLIAVDGYPLAIEQDFGVAIRISRQRYFSGRRRGLNDDAVRRSTDRLSGWVVSSTLV